MEELDHYTGKVWTHILSLKRKDATRLDCDNAKVWMNLLRTNHNDIAAMNIPPNHFRWYAVFHDEVNATPDVHMMAWSDDPKVGFLTQKGIASIRSKMTNEIFRDEMTELYIRKDAAYKESIQTAKALYWSAFGRWKPVPPMTPGLRKSCKNSPRHWRRSAANMSIPICQNRSRHRWMPLWSGWRSSRRWRLATTNGGS